MANVKPIPEGYGTITPGLVVRNGAKAIDFYKKAFGAEERMRMPGPDGTSIMHAELRIGSSIVMLNDENPQWGALSPESLKGTPCGFYLYVNDADAWQKRAIDAGATELMPVQDMFWGDRMGSVVDPFGHKWNIATHVRDLSIDEIKKGQAAWMKEMAQKQH